MKKKADKKKKGIIKEPDKEFIKGYENKSYAQLMSIIEKGQSAWVLGSYEVLRAARTMHLYGRFKDGKFESFEEWLRNMTFLNIDQYYRYIGIAMKYEKRILEMVGFKTLDIIESPRLLENRKEALISEICQRIEKNESPQSLSEIRKKARELYSPRKELFSKKVDKDDLYKDLYRKEKELNHRLSEEIKDLKAENMKLKVKIEDQERYIKELQQGKRPV